ncbi:hypothetical protein G6O67_006518 [Ophiocordyceps sinensis]|uniref:Uncharacterized protein n=1 Tax=Ophiocordyceps sinensis TaxID=72228 RepID=A0A8H4LVT5_9HYPO|nr:hypothetical protein G6O67_006518 [Ophiocordyceps sinensis]
MTSCGPSPTPSQSRPQLSVEYFDPLAGSLDMASCGPSPTPSEVDLWRDPSPTPLQSGPQLSVEYDPLAGPPKRTPPSDSLPPPPRQSRHQPAVEYLDPLARPLGARM